MNFPSFSFSLNISYSLYWNIPIYLFIYKQRCCQLKNDTLKVQIVTIVYEINLNVLFLMLLSGQGQFSLIHEVLKIIS